MGNSEKIFSKKVLIKKISVFLRSQMRAYMRRPLERQKAVVAQW